MEQVQMVKLDVLMRMESQMLRYQNRQKNQYSREHLDEFILYYNKEFGTNLNMKDTQSFYNYYNDIARRVKNKQIDVFLGVNMFLTGFDSKMLNTIYDDKNLKYYGLIQAYSRTNRILEEKNISGKCSLP